MEVDAEDDDSSLYMQLGMRKPWTQVLRKLQVALEGQPKGTRECNIRRLLSWLDHRITNYQDGYFLGHAQGNSADLLALLVAYRDAQLEVPAHEDLRSGWCLDWELLLASYLPLHPGSRGALGLPMLRDPPIMLFSKPMPDSSDSELERATQLLPGSRSGKGEKGPTHSPGVDDLLEDEAEDRERCAREQRQLEQEAAHEESLQEEADRCLVDRQVGAADARKRKAVVVELSSGSADAPRVSRMMRVPMDDAGVVQMSLRLWVEDGGDFEDVNTEPAECMSPITALQPNGTAAGLPRATLAQTAEDDTPDLAALSELTFAEVQEVFSQWTTGVISSAEVVRRHGRATLHFLESQWAVQGGTQEESARVRLLAEASDEVARARPARVYTDFHDLFAVWKSGGISSVDVVAAYGPAVLERLRRAWREYMSGAHAAAAVAKYAGSESEHVE